MVSISGAEPAVEVVDEHLVGLAIELVTQEWISNMLHMNTDLMGSSGVDAAGDQGVAFHAL